MKKTFLWKTAAVAALMLTSSNANAQFLKNLAKAATSAATSTTNTTATEESSDTTKIDWSKIPVYSIQKVYVVDDQGNKVTNADGTLDYRMFLVDQFGNRRSGATVKAQQKKIKQAVGNILLKVGSGAALGALSGLASGGGSNVAVGAATGAATGALASIDDIKMAKKQKKSLKQQEKLVEEYQKNFTEEGKPVNASVDTSKLAGFDIKEENTLSMTTNDIKKEIDNNPSFTKDDSAWEI